eukprot:13349555-Alexandrium_andersonii.AAC.1
MPNLAQTRSPELSRDPLCVIIRSGSGAEMERFPRFCNNQNKLNNGKHLEQLEQLEQLKQFQLLLASGAEFLKAPKGGPLRTEFKAMLSY